MAAATAAGGADQWSTLEKLLLTQAVHRYGENWVTIQRVLQRHPAVLTRNNRAASFFNQRTCAWQWSQLLDQLEGSRRSKRATEPATSEIPPPIKLAQMLYSQRVDELKASIAHDEEEYRTLSKNISDVRAGLLDHRLTEILSTADSASNGATATSAPDDTQTAEATDAAAPSPSGSTTSVAAPSGDVSNDGLSSDVGASVGPSTRPPASTANVLAGVDSVPAPAISVGSTAMTVPSQSAAVKDEGAPSTAPSSTTASEPMVVKEETPLADDAVVTRVARIAAEEEAERQRLEQQAKEEQERERQAQRERLEAEKAQQRQQAQADARRKEQERVERREREREERARVEAAAVAAQEAPAPPQEAAAGGEVSSTVGASRTPEPARALTAGRGGEGLSNRRRSYSVASESDLSAPATPAPPAASGQSSATPVEDDSERQHRLKAWRKSALLVWREIAQLRYANVFTAPVKKEDAPDYYETVHRPMDLTTIKNNITDGTISSTAEFQRDVLLTFVNACMYNNDYHAIYEMAVDVLPKAESLLATLRSADAVHQTFAEPSGQSGSGSLKRGRKGAESGGDGSPILSSTEPATPGANNAGSAGGSELPSTPASGPVKRRRL